MNYWGCFLITLGLCAVASANEISLEDGATVIGKKGHCKTNSHIGERVISASSIKASLNGKILKITANIQHLECTKTKEAYVYRPVRALAKSTHKNKITDGYYDIYRLFGHAVVSSPMSSDPVKTRLTHTESQEISFTWEVNKLLANKDFSKIQKDGHYKVEFDYFHTYLTQITQDGKKYEKTLQATSAYRLSLLVEETSTGWTLKKIN